MARTRLEMHEELCKILGSRNVYFRKPSKGMNYPCILYDMSGIYADKADNQDWREFKNWTLTIIDENPDSLIPERLRKNFNYCRFDRSFIADGLNHFVLTLYY